ncbi:hypothetical protein B0J17DRAFT_295143 [Rhizoctonia solani]|nr:hypothetical protein B0J17DRAFT_295143 [Rhizoctonia solani]
MNRATLSIPPEDIIVDDIDSNHISYSEWEEQVFQSSRHVFHHNNTLHRTNQPGSFATFKFNGTTVWYITDYFPDHGVVNITLDAKPGGLVNGSSGSNVALAQRILWNATNLPYGEHTVVVTHQDTAGLYATLDYFRYLSANQAYRLEQSLEVWLVE